MQGLGFTVLGSQTVMYTGMALAPSTGVNATVVAAGLLVWLECGCECEC